MGSELANCENVLLAEIAAASRDDVAKTYRLALLSSEACSVDWSKVNRAIIDKWCKNALDQIKTQAWRGLKPSRHRGPVAVLESE